MIFSVQFDQNPSDLSVSFEQTSSDVMVIFEGISRSPSEVYRGSYQVTPMIVAQTLATTDKLMQHDVVVEEIPYSEVSNNSGGETATIG